MKKLGLLALLMIGVQCYGAEVPITEREAEVLGNRFYLGKREANNYPFSLPEDRVTVNTVYVSNQRGQEVSAETLPIIQEKVSHIIVEDEVDIRLFAALARGGLEKGYGIHFYGLNRLEGLGDILRAWSGDESTAYLHHLDVAIQGMKEGDLRREVVGRVGEALSLPASEKLETLSLRFMHLDPENMGYLYGILRDRPRPFLKRLILSYNDLTDDLLGTGGALEQIIGDRTQFPSLSIMDLRGNSFESIERWSVGRVLHERGSIKLLINGFTERNFNTPTAAALVGFVRSSVESPREAIQKMKAAFDEKEERTIQNTWFLEGKYETSEDIYPYQDLGDIFLLVTHGVRRDWDSLDLKEKRAEPRDILDLLRRVSSLTTINLEGAYRGDRSFDPDDQRAIVAHLQRLPLVSLSLGSNRLGHIVSAYEDLGILSTLKRLDFNDNGIGSAPTVSPIESTETDSFLRGIRHGFSELRALNLQWNLLTDRDFKHVLGIIQQKRGGVYDLSKNKIALEGDLESHFLSGLRTFAHNPALQEEPLYIDLRDNEIDEIKMRGFVSAYEREIEANSNLNWPVIRMNSELRPAHYGRESIMGNVKGLANVIRARGIREGPMRLIEEGQEEDRLTLRTTRVIEKEKWEFLPLLNDVDVGAALWNRLRKEGPRSILSFRKIENLQTLNLQSSIEKKYQHIVIGALGSLTGLTDLNLGSNSLGEEGAKHLAVALVNIPKLKKLNIGYNKFGTPGLEVLQSSLSFLTHLEQLFLYSNQLGEGVTPDMLGSILSHLTKLEFLHLDNNAFGDEGLRKLRLEALPNLQELRLGSTGIRDGAFLRDTVRLLSKLEAIDLIGNNLGSSRIELFTRAFPFLNSLKTIYFSNNAMGIAGARAFGENLRFLTSLDYLYLRNNNVGDEGIEAIAPNLPSSIRMWDFVSNAIGDRGARALAESFARTTRLESIVLFSNPIGDEGMEAIARRIALLPSLKTLRCYQQGGELAAIALADSLRVATRLETLEFGATGFGASTHAFRQLASSLERNTPFLRALYFTSASMGDEGAAALAIPLRNLTHLTILNIDHNDIREEGMEALAPSLAHLSRLSHLTLGGNIVGGRGATALGLSLEGHTAMEYLNLYNNLSST